MFMRRNVYALEKGPCMKPHLLVSLLLAFTASIVVSADTIHFKDGSKREGTVKEDKEDVVVFEMRHGSVTATMRFERKDIVKIDKVEVVETAEERKYKLLLQSVEYLTNNAGSKADIFEAWVQVAEFCEKTPGYSAGAREAFRRLAALSPDDERIKAWLRYHDEEIATVTSKIYDESLPDEVRYSTLRIPQSQIDQVKNMQIGDPGQYIPMSRGEIEQGAYSATTYASAPATSSAGGNYNNTYSDNRVIYNSYYLRPVYVLNGNNNYYYNNRWKRGVSNYTNGRQYWDQRPNYTWNQPVYNRTGPCGNNYVQPRPTAQTVGSFQDARTSTYQVPNSYFGVSTGNFDTRTQRWVGPRPR